MSDEGNADTRREKRMHVFTRVAVTISLLTLAAVGAAVTAGSSSAASDVVGHVYVNDNTAGANTVAAFDRHADGTLTPMPGSPFPVGGAGTGAGLGPRARSSSAPTGGSSSRSTPAATRSPCCGSTRGDTGARRRPGLLRGRRAGQYRHQRRAGVRRERRRRRQQLHRLLPQPGRPADSAAGYHRPGPRGIQARRRAVQLRRRQARRDPGRPPP